jgi:hypothetical protein
MERGFFPVHDCNVPRGELPWEVSGGVMKRGRSHETTLKLALRKSMTCAHSGWQGTKWLAQFDVMKLSEENCAGCPSDSFNLVA